MATLRDWFGPIDDPALMQRDLVPVEARALSTAVPGWQTGKPSWPNDNVAVLTRDGYRKAVTAFACINIISDAVAEATLRVWLEEGAAQRTELDQHPLRLLMQAPNRSQSESEFLSLVVRTAAITGFSVIEKVRSARGNVVALGRLDPRYITPILHDGRPPDWEYTIPGTAPAILAAEDAIVFTYMDSIRVDEVTGDTPLRAVLREAGILNDLIDFVKVLLESGGIPPFVLVVDSDDADGGPPERLSPGEIELAREQFRQRYGGYQNWTGPAVLDGMRVERVGLDINQMAFKELRDAIDLSVCRAFRVPAPIVQIMAGLTTSYGQLLEQSMKLLQMYTANPLRSRLDGALTRQLLPEFDVRPNTSLEFDTSGVDALQEDENAIHERARADLVSGGMTIDEFRLRTDLPPLDNDLGRSLLLPFSVIPTSTTAPAPTPDEDEEARRQPVVTRNGRRYLNARSLTTAQATRQDAFQRRDRQQQGQLTLLLEPRVRAYLGEQKGRVLDAYGVRDEGEGLDVRALEDDFWETERELLRPLFAQWANTVGEQAFAAANDQFGLGAPAWTVSNQWLRELTDLLGGDIVAITETTRRDVENIVITATTEGTTMPGLAEALEGLYDETYANRSMTIARTESQRAYNTASVMGYEASSAVDEALLLDNPDHDTDPGSDGLTCAQRNLMVIALSEARKHIDGEHQNGSLGVAPYITPLTGGSE